MKAEPGTYKLVVECLNCGYKGEIGIKKGYTIEKKACPYCDCATLERRAKLCESHRWILEGLEE